MFYEEDRIKEKLKCPACQSLFDENNPPRILEFCCMNNCCNQCLKSTLSSQEPVCPLCKSPTVSGNRTNACEFKTNSAMLEIAKLEPSDVFRGPEIENLKEMIHVLKFKIDDLAEQAKYKENDKIKSSCDKLRAEVDCTKESLKSELDRLAEALKSQISCFENDCLANLCCDGFGCRKRNVQSIINDASDFYDKYHSYLKNSVVDEAEIASAVKQVYRKEFILDKASIIQRMNICCGRQLIYEKDTVKLDPDVLGHFRVETVDFKIFKRVYLNELFSVSLKELFRDKNNLCFSLIECMDNGSFVLVFSDTCNCFASHLVLVDKKGELVKWLDIQERIDALTCFKDRIVVLTFGYETEKYRKSDYKYSLQLHDANLNVTSRKHIQNGQMSLLAASESFIYICYGQPENTVNINHPIEASALESQYTLDLFDHSLKLVKRFNKSSSLDFLSKAPRELTAFNEKLFVRLQSGELVVLEESSLRTLLTTGQMCLSPRKTLIDKHEKIIQCQMQSLYFYDSRGRKEHHMEVEADDAGQKCFTILFDENRNLIFFKTDTLEILRCF